MFVYSLILSTVRQKKKLSLIIHRRLNVGKWYRYDDLTVNTTPSNNKLWKMKGWAERKGVDKVPLKKHPLEIEIESCRGKIAKVGGWIDRNKMKNFTFSSFLRHLGSKSKSLVERALNAYIRFSVIMDTFALSVIEAVKGNNNT